MIAVCPLGEDATASAGMADAVIARPLLRSEIEDLLERLANGDTHLAAAQPAPEAAGTAAQFRPFKALVADDNAVNREVAGEALAQLGASVTMAENGIEAIAAMEAESFDIVFMDGSMPGMDGFEATRRIRAAEAQSARERSVIVALTAHVIGIHAEAWRESGMDDVVHKPFTMARLARTIEKLVPRLSLARVAAGMDAGAPTGKSDNGKDLLDPQVIEQLEQMQLAGKADFVHKVLGLYREHAPAAVARLREAAAQMQPDACAQAAHSLKSMSFNVGATVIAERAGQIEVFARPGGQCPDRSTLDALSRCLDATLEAIEKAHPAANAPTGAPNVISAASEFERALTLALERNELFLLYQPIVDRNGTQTCGVEALLRWKRQDREPISPARFIPVAEKTGLIHEIGDWALRRACEDGAEWPSLKVAVNVSPIQFARPDLADRFGRILGQTGFDGRRLSVEITESALLEAEHAVLQAMEHLRARGATFALDDFGTGYSSLNYLRRFPFGSIKIDKGFIEHLDTTVDATIVHAIASIGRSLGLKLVAEGIETTDQHRFVYAAGVHFMQGYLFGRPMAKDEITSRLAEELAATKAMAARP